MPSRRNLGRRTCGPSLRPSSKRRRRQQRPVAKERRKPRKPDERGRSRTRPPLRLASSVRLKPPKPKPLD